MQDPGIQTLITKKKKTIYLRYFNNFYDIKGSFDGQDRREAGYDIKLDRDRI